MTAEDPLEPSGATGAEAHASMQKRVHARIREMIADGRIRPGERLLEVHVARAFSVSRSPARHALETLWREKIVRPAAGRGYVVVGPRELRGGTSELAMIDAAPVVQPSSARWKQVYADLEAQICVGVVSQSLRITEERVAEHFEVSRTVARDALARLQSVGMVDKDRQGRWVAQRITAERLHSLYELRWLLEPAALLHSAPALPRDRLEAAHDRMRSALMDLPTIGSEVHIALEKDLHIDLLAACPNLELLRVLERARALLVSNPHRLNFYVGEPDDHVHSSLHQHLDVLERLLAKDYDAAALTLRHHLQDSCAFWMQCWTRVENRPSAPLPPYATPID